MQNDDIKNKENVEEVVSDDIINYQDEVITPQKAWSALLSMLKGNKALLKRVMIIAEFLVKEGMRPSKEALVLKKNITPSRNSNVKLPVGNKKSSNKVQSRG